MTTPEPTGRELQILVVLWRRGEATVREVYEELREGLGIAQNTVQTFMRTMTDKGLVGFRKEGRTFVYSPLVDPERTKTTMLGGLLQRAFDGAVDQLIESAVALQRPTDRELARLRAMLDDMEPAPTEGPR